MATPADTYRKRITNPFIYFFFMLWRLPSLVFWGVRVRKISEFGSEVTIKHGWRNQNPFGSLYFSALTGAAELSTGILIQAVLQDLSPYSMLVVESHANFTKKAKGIITLTCNEGKDVSATIEEMEKTGGTRSFWLTSVGRDEAGNEIGSFKFLWSLKKK